MASDKTESGAGVCLLAIGAFAFFGWASCSGPNSTQTTGGTAAQREPEPTGAAAAPSPNAKELIRKMAKENGISEEEARQALRKGALKGYSQEEVDRSLGK